MFKQAIPEISAHKKDTFMNCMKVASIHLRSKDFHNAEMLYMMILSDLREHRLDELQLNDLDVFSIHCCLAYCSLAVDIRSEKAMQMLESQRYIEVPLVPYLKTRHYLSTGNISSAESSLNHCNRLLEDGYNFRPNMILNADIIPEINEDFIKSRLNVLTSTCVHLRTHKIAKPIINFLDKGVDIQYNIGDDMHVQIFDTTDHESLPKMSMTPVRSNSIKLTSASTQTAKAKCVNTTSQTSSKNARDPELMDAIRDIRDKVANLQGRREDEVKRLEMKLSEKADQLAAKEKKLVELNQLKQQHNQLMAKYEVAQKQIDLLQKKLTEEMQHKFTMQRAVYSMLADKCQNKIVYFSEIKPLLINRTDLTAEECGDVAVMWRRVLDKLIVERRKLDGYQETLRENLTTIDKMKNLSLSNWPEIPQVPNDLQDVVYVRFKQILVNDLTRNEALNSNATNSDAPVRNVKMKPPPVGAQSLEASSSSATASRPMSLSYARVASENPPPSTSTSTFSDDDEGLYNFLQTSFPGVEEVVWLSTFFQVRDKYGANNNELSKDTVVKEMRQLMQRRKRIKYLPLSGIALPLPILKDMPELIDWQEDISNCIICYDDLHSGKVSTLTCQHEFHSKCIMMWLKQGSTCPVCRTPVTKGQKFAL